MTIIPPPATAGAPIQVIPLGGTDRVGMNATLIGQNGRFVLIDLGATFIPADQRIHGLRQIERIVPDLGAVAPWIAAVEGVIITHAHQDHIGALTTLIADQNSPLAETPIYATPFTAAMIARSYEELSFRPRLRTVEPSKRVQIGPFRIRWVPVSHSIPDTSMVVIETDQGAIVVGTDIKNDDDPILGVQTDFASLEEIGQQGVLAFLADSTNAHRSGRSRSEHAVMQSLAEAMDRHPGRVIISSFSSNVERVASAYRAASDTGRSLGLMGRSLLTTMDIAQDTGHLAKDIRLFHWKDLDVCADRNAAIVCTGTQAEERSALRDMVDRLGSVRSTLRRSDMFIHSARTIPGNELAVNDMLEAMRRHGITVVTAEEGVHTTGHGHREELIEFHRALNPRYAVPVHGSRDLIGHHLELTADLFGPDRSISPNEGEILEFRDGRAAISGRIPTGSLARIRDESHPLSFGLKTWNGAAP